LLSQFSCGKFLFIFYHHDIPAFMLSQYHTFGIQSKLDKAFREKTYFIEERQILDLRQ
jgi:hypothetical protein